MDINLSKIYSYLEYDLSSFLFFSFFILMLSCGNDKKTSNYIESDRNDTIQKLIVFAKERKLEESSKLLALERANYLVMLEDNDSLKVRNLFKIADVYYSLRKDSLFLEINRKAFHIATKNKNYKDLAEYHWNRGNLYRVNEVLDSSFYHYHKAHGFYQLINHDYYRAKMEYNMSFIHFRIRNYVQSEKLIISAIEDYRNLGKYYNLYLSYNRLLLLDKELENFDMSLDRYTRALEYLNKSGRKGFHKEKLLNNLSLVYQKQKDYQKAIATLDKALLNKELRDKNLNLYTKIIDNRAYSKFLMGEEKGVLEDFEMALHLRDSMSNKAGVGISRMHLSEYYLQKGDSAKAFDHADQAQKLARQYGLNRDILSSLVLMSKADPINASRYMNDYISLNDSLLLEERKIRDKFTRIQFDTEEYMTANEELKKRNIWISLSSVLGLASLSLFFFGYRQKARNKTLILQQQQQKANEEIYDLMLKQQSREEEGRIQERVRISEELHDGALARLFSVRMGLGFLKVSGGEKEAGRYEEFMTELQRVEKEIRTLSRALKNEDLSTKMDFPKLLSELLEEQSGIGKFSFELIQDSSIAWNQVDEKIKINLFRTIQESICNIIKYAGCTKVKVSLKKKQYFIVLKIVDNGRGFNTNKKYKGIGLKNMRSRAKSIGSELEINSEPGKGTEIILRIPNHILYHEETA